MTPGYAGEVREPIDRKTALLAQSIQALSNKSAQRLCVLLVVSGHLGQTP